MVIDTQSFLWMHDSSPRLSKAARMVIPSRLLYVPAIVLWEVAMLASRGRVTLNQPIREWLEEAVSQPNIQLCPITPEIAATSVSLDMHGDPSDRLVVATALCLGMPLITSDKKIRKSGLVQTIW